MSTEAIEPIEAEPAAPHGRRALAWLIDLAWVGLVALTVAGLLPWALPALVNRAVDSEEEVTLKIDPELLFPFAAAYFIVYHTTVLWLTGRTAGKAMFGLRLRWAEGRSGLLWGLGRTSFGYSVIDVLGLGALLALSNPRHWCLHDRVFGSEVVWERREPVRLRTLWSSLLDFETERRAESERRTESLRIFQGFARFLLKLAFPLAWLLQIFSKGEKTAMAPPQAPIASVAPLSAKATVAVVAATTAITSVTTLGVLARDRGNGSSDGNSSLPITTTSGAPGLPVTVPADPAPSLFVGATRLDFGDQEVSTSSAERSVDLTNEGSAPAFVEGADVTGADPDDFSIRAGACTEAAIAPRTGCRIPIRFNPRRVGGRSANLEIRPRRGDPLTVALVGSGTGPNGLTTSGAEVFPTRLDFGEQEVRTTSGRMTAVVTSRRAEPFSIQRVDLSGGDDQDFVVDPSCSGVSISPERSCSIGIAFTPTAIGGRSASLEIHHAAGLPLTVALSGTGLEGPTTTTSSPPIGPQAQESIVFASGTLNGSVFGEDNEIYGMAPTGTSPTQLTSNGPDARDPSVSSDGSRIAFSRHVGGGNYEIHVMNSDGSDQTPITQTRGVSEFEPDWSPDGRQLVFRRSDPNGDAGELVVMNVDGTGERPLASHQTEDRDPQWSPDGSRIAFASQRDGDLEIYVVNASDGSGLTQLTDNTAADDAPAWSPDGARLALSSDRDGDPDIYVMSATDGSGVMQLTKNGDIDVTPTWSPKGDRVAFSGSRPRSGFANYNVHLINADGSNETPLFGNDAKEAEFAPDWR